MDRARRDELWTRFLERGRLAPDEESELLEAFSSAPALRDEILDDEELDGLLHVLGRSGSDAPTFVREFLDRWSAGRDAEQFLRKFRERMGGLPSRESATSPGQGRGRLRRFRAAAVVAAALIAALLGFFAFRPDGRMIVRLEAVDGSVYVLSGTGRLRASTGQTISNGEQIQTEGERSRASLRYEDASLLELEGDALVRLDGNRRRKRVFLEQGVLSAEVSKQPDGVAMILETRAAEVVVLGTKVTLLSEPATGRASVGKGGVALDRSSVDISIVGVDQGAVQVTRKGDSKSIEVVQGQYATAAEGVDFTPQPLSTASGPTRSTYLGHTAAVWHVSFSPDGSTFATVSEDRTVKLWKRSGDGEPFTLGKRKGDWFFASAFSPDGRTLASTAGDHTRKGVHGEVVLWDIASAKEKATLRGHSGAVWCAAFSPDGKILATGSEDGLVKLWQVETGRELRTLRGHADQIWSLCFSPDGRTLASGGEDKSVRIWDVLEGRVQTAFEDHPDFVLSVAFTPDGQTLASATGRHADRVVAGEIRLWDLRTGRERRRLKGHRDSIWSIAFSPDGRLLASGSFDKTVRVWDALTGQERTTLTGHQGGIWSLGFAPDGRSVASASEDWTVKVWDTSATK